MASIRPIDQKSIHRLQSGQVIVDLGSVVKELVENSIDARATIIDVRFKNQGLDSIEVQDNGAGIAPDDYETVALKHCTSKLSSYSDIADLATFGFRGEALASLSALSHLTIVTCQQLQAPKGFRLEFEPSGKLKRQTVTAAQRGTTVAVESLFHNLPVRRRELQRNIKREWTKIISLLNQYACVQTGIKFTVSQQPTKGKKITLFSTKGNSTTRDNIINIFGAKALSTLVPLDLCLEITPSLPSVAGPTLHARGGVSREVKIVGHVSRPAHGDGRQAPDRQMFFVNGRPCHLPQFARAFNEVYRSYNSTQSPFVMANIIVDTHLYDVNVSPDKRTILLHDQDRLLDDLKLGLAAKFDAGDYTIPTNRLSSPATTLSHICRGGLGDLSRASAAAQSLSPTEGGGGRSHGSGDREECHKENSEAVEEPFAPHDSSDGICGSLDGKSDGDRQSQERLSFALEANLDSTGRIENPPYSQAALNKPINAGSASLLGEPFGRSEPRPSRPRLLRSPDTVRHSRRSSPLSREVRRRHDDIGSRDSPRATLPNQTPFEYEGSGQSKPYIRETDALAESNGPSRRTRSPSQGGVDDVRCVAGSVTGCRSSDDDSRRNSAILESVRGLHQNPIEPLVEHGSASRRTSSSGSAPTPSPTPYYATGLSGLDLESSHHLSDNRNQVFKLGENAGDEKDDGQITKRLSFLRTRSKSSGTTRSLTQVISTTEDFLASALSGWRMAVSMSVPTDNLGGLDKYGARVKTGNIEDQQSLSVSKEDFKKLRIVGQFNHGFILAVRRASCGSDDDDIFIIDQHASDEKYNFERLQSVTKVQAQRLVHSKRLGFTAVEEETVLNNLDVLEANGFKITVDAPEQPVGSRCILTALPVSRETTFTIDDLEELVSLLCDEDSTSSTTLPRPSRVRRMFAMRACRSSIMIGRALSFVQMEKVVRHMGDLDKPWNCPHGRPTMRHLCGLP